MNSNASSARAVKPRMRVRRVDLEQADRHVADGGAQAVAGGRDVAGEAEHRWPGAARSEARDAAEVARGGQLRLLVPLGDAGLGGEAVRVEAVDDIQLVARPVASSPKTPKPGSRQVDGMTSVSTSGRSTPLKVGGS